MSLPDVSVISKTTLLISSSPVPPLELSSSPSFALPSTSSSWAISTTVSKIKGWRIVEMSSICATTFLVFRSLIGEISSPL